MADEMKELKFLTAIWKTNLQSAMEYRAAFLTQVIGMMANNFIYFAIWIIFFDRFKDVRGWGANDMYVTFGVLASAFGLVSLLFGNAFTLSDIIAKGRLDYYLSLPRPVLLHTIASRTIASGMGDFVYGFISYGLSGYFNLGWADPLRSCHPVSCHCFCGIPYPDTKPGVLVWHDDQFQQSRSQRHANLWYLSHHII